jgi:lysophospholipase L1-like esterase
VVRTNRPGYSKKKKKSDQIPASTAFGSVHDLASRAPLAGGAKLRILPLGDSITHGYLSTGDNGYRQQLWNSLSENEKDFVGTQPIGTMPDPDNEGYNGAVISEIMERCDVALSMRPNVVLIHAGTNDMNRPFEPDTAPERLGQLIDKVVSVCPDAAVLVAKLVPASGPNTMSRINAFNAEVPVIVSSRVGDGKKVMVVDMDELSVSELVDGLHPTDAGYNHMGDIWYSAIVQAGENGWIDDPVPGASTGASCSYIPVWFPQGQIASGVGTSAEFVDAWMPKGEIASGIGKGANLRFGDIDGDGRDDYLWVSDSGAVTAYLNTAGSSADEVVWVPQGEIASGYGYSALTLANC